MNFGKIFKQARKQAGVSQKQVADYLGIHQSNVSDWENDVSRPEYEKLLALCVFYDVSLDDLLDLERFKKSFAKKKSK